MAKDINPAARLLLWIETAKRQDNSRTAISVWCKVFDLKDPDPPGVFRRLGYLLDLAEETETLVRKIPDLDYDLYLSGLPQIREGLSYLNLNNPWEGIKPYFSERSLAHLSFCAERIAKHFPEQEITEDTLRELAADVDTLFDKIAASPLKSDLKELFLALLERMRRAIAEYRIRGAGSLREALENSVGRLVLRGRANGEPSSDEEKSLYDQVKQLLWRFNEIVNQAVKWKVLAESFKAALEHLSSK